MPTAVAKATQAQKDYKPKKVVIKHGAFWYHARELVVRPNKDTGELEEVEALVEKVANQNEELEVPLVKDYIRGMEIGAFWSDDEIGVDPQSPGGQAVVSAPEDQLDPGAVANFSELEAEDLVDFLMSTGMFDSRDKPTVDEVLDQVGDDPALAQRMLDAEASASGGSPRTTLEEGLLRIVERHENE
jgi:hypothetical protein